MRQSAFDLDRHFHRAALTMEFSSGWKESRRDTTNKRARRRYETVFNGCFEITWPHSSWRNCFVRCTVFVDVQGCAGNVLYPLVHRTFQYHIYRTGADMFGEFSLGRATDRGRWPAWFCSRDTLRQSTIGRAYKQIRT
jgi:hypothetical protein